MTTVVKEIEKPDPAPWWAWAILAVIVLLLVAWHIDFDTKGGKSSNKTAYPICADTASRIEASLTKVVEVPLHPKCKSGWIHLPYGFKGYLETGINRELEVWFLDGRHVLAPKGKPVPFGDHPNNRDFQVRGDEGVLRIEPWTKPVTAPPPPIRAMPALPAKPISPKGWVV